MYEIFEELCNLKGVTPYRVGKETKIATSTLSDWKNGKSTPKQDKLQLIADYFGVTLDYIVSGKEKEMPLTDQADLWIAIRKDKELLNALEKYMELSDEKKKHILDTIDVLSEV